ncbi:cyclic nucleotide-binding domain-containing protein [Streptomyces sp. HNM0574]|uniref:Crp/Fnr family transcriptional regulator n=1 Tax=Streptomyces sp. HNM0574 TaxID=2714954 RepID=UPI00146BE46C|nr:cyclic nucleotide-binding domain-containing protein [Streptomyces sp. HNM0574]NLU67919.1 cyclic nucleotide-binding domain-containing protein [Streptomyces sp. HNM0574]
MRTMTGFFGVLPAGHSERLRELGREAAFPVGTRIFEEGMTADRFWVLRTGSVSLDMRVPGRRAVVTDELGQGELLGWSWLFAPYVWRLGAEASSPVRALEFDAAPVRRLCAEDHELGHALTHAVAVVIGQRLQRTRTRLLDVFGPGGEIPDGP